MPEGLDMSARLGDVRQEVGRPYSRYLFHTSTDDQPDMGFSARLGYVHFRKGALGCAMMVKGLVIHALSKHTPGRFGSPRGAPSLQGRFLTSVVAATVLTLAVACGGQDEAGVSDQVLAAAQGIGGGGGSPPADAQGDALPPGRSPFEVAAQYQVQMDELWGTLEKHPHDGGALLRMGQLMQDARQPREAAYYYERYLQILPESQAVWLRLANTYGAASDWLGSADASFRMLERFPEDASAMYSLGAALANQGQYEDARGWWEKVLQADDPIMTGRALRALERLSEL